MTESETVNVLLSSPVFNGCEKKDVSLFLQKFGNTISFRRGEIIPLFDAEPRFALILEGSAAIYSEGGNKRALLRVASPPDPIGIAGLYSGLEISTVCEAENDGCVCCFFGLSGFEEIMSSSGGSVVRQNVLGFLSRRVAFLNSRIACLTGGSAIRRLAAFILANSDASGVFRPDITMKSLSSALDVGRASLYRALDRLTATGAITYKDNIISISDYSALEKICSE